MKTRTQIKTDRVVGVFIALLLNWLVRLIGKIFRPNHELQKKHKTIVVCKYKGMGSIIQATPFLKALKKNQPQSRIVFLSTVNNLELLNKIPQIDTLVLVNDRSFFSLLRTSLRALMILWKLRVGVFFDLEIYSNYSSLMTTLSLAKNRLGYYRQASHYRMGIYTHMMYFNIKAPIAEAYLQFARLLGYNEDEKEIHQFDIDAIKCSAKIKEISDCDYIVINANASDLRIERRWPRASFIELIKKIIENHKGKKIVLIGSTSEESYVSGVVTEFKNHPTVISLAGKTNLDELLLLIKNASVVITNDTGPMHIAFSYMTKTVAMFGPCSPAQYGSHQNCGVLYQNLYCSPCVHEFDIPPCKGDNQCMKNISVDQVLKAFEEILCSIMVEKNRAEKIVYTSESGDILGLANRK
jgi:ADP-heptose:LPS heptosyltransferase